MHLRESKYSFLLGKKILLVFTFSCHSYETLQFLGHFCKKYKRSGWYPMHGIQKITFPVTVIRFCICSSKKEKCSVSHLVTHCVGRQLKISWKQPPLLLHTHVIALLQNKVSITALFRNIPLTCVKCVPAEFYRSFYKRMKFWGLQSKCELGSPKLWKKTCINKLFCARNVSCYVWWRGLFWTWF